MPEFLSDRWFDALGRRLVRLRLAEPLVVGIVVARSQGTVEYQVRFGNDGTTVQRSPVRRGDVTLLLDEEAARQLADGQASAQQLLFAGRLEIHGDMSRLVEHGDAIARLVGPDSPSVVRTPDEVSP